MASRDHGGTCPFCSTVVRQGFSTCSSCGATYRSELSVRQTFGWLFGGLPLIAILMSVVVAFVLFGVAEVLGVMNGSARMTWTERLSNVSFASIPVFWLVGMAIVLRKRKSRAWFRVQN